MQHYAVIYLFKKVYRSIIMHFYKNIFVSGRNKTRKKPYLVGTKYTQCKVVY